MVSRLDAHVGEVLALLKQRGLDDNTIVFFTSDNGAQAGAWQRLAEFFQATGSLRGYKGQFYEGGIRVPLLARWPGRIRAGAVSDHVCAFWDVLPTLAELAGTKPPARVDGRSFLPTLLGTGSQDRHEFLYWEYPFPAGLVQAVRMGDWKLVQPGPGKPFELYNLKDDPGESRNMAGGQPQVMAKLQNYLATARTEPRQYPARPPQPTVKDYVR
jgi:arylsulfatase A-like enzyme